MEQEEDLGEFAGLPFSELLRRSKEIRKEFGDRDEPPPTKLQVPLFIPEIYRLGWDTRTGSLLIHINKTAFLSLQKMHEQGTTFLSSNFISRQLEALGLTLEEFGIPGKSKTLGKGGHIIQVKESENYVTYSWSFEKIPEESVCFACGGDGREVFNNTLPCMECGGAGRKVLEHDPLEEAAGSFGVLMYIFLAIQKIERLSSDRNQTRHQLVSPIISTPYNKAPEGMFVRMDSSVVDHMKNITEEKLQHINNAMRQARQILCGEEYGPDTFEVFRDGQHFAFAVPNTDSGLLFDSDAPKLETDYERDTHETSVLSGQNLTRRLDDLILLAGLGGLSDSMD